MPSDQAVYSEVLQITVDASQFKAGLDAIEQAYREFVDRVGSDSAATVSGVGQFAAVAESLESLKSTIIETNAAELQSFQQLSSELSQYVEQIRQSETELERLREQAASRARGRSGGGGKEQGPALGGLFSGDSLLGDVGNLAKVYIQWQLIGAAVQGVATILSSPFVAIRDGVTYLGQMQEKADELRGVLVANVKFSENFDTNLQLASKSAEDVAHKIQDIAVKDSLKEEDLTRLFKAFTEAGGATVTASLKDALSVTEQLALAFRASGASAQSIRAAITDVDKLLNGTLSPSSKLVEVTGLSAAKFKEMVESAKTNKDLAEQLSKALEPYLAATETAAGHHVRMVNSLELMKQRLEGIAATEVFQELDKYLAKLLDYLKENSHEIESWVMLLGKAARAVGEDLAGAFSGLARGPLRVVAALIADMYFMVEDMANKLNRLKGSLPGGQKGLESAKDLLAGGDGTKGISDVEAEFKRNDERIQKQYDLVDKLLKGEAVLRGKQHSSTLDLPIGSTGKENPSLDKPGNDLGGFKAEFIKDADSIKAKYDELREKVQEDLSAQTISHRTAADLIAGYADTEIQAVERATKAYKDSIKESSAKPEQKDKATEQADDYLIKLNEAIGKGVSNQVRQSNAEEVALREAGVKATIDTEERKKAAVESITKESLALGYGTELEALALQETLEKNAYDLKVRLMNQEIAALGDGTIKRNALTIQLAAADEAYTNLTDQMAVRRIGITEKEAAQRREFTLRAAQEDINQHITSIETQGLADGEREKYAEVYALQRLSIALKRDEIAAELALSEARNADSETVRKLRLELQSLNGALLNNIKANQGAINSSVDPEVAKASDTRRLGRNIGNDLTNDIATRANNLTSRQNAGAVPGESDEQFKSAIKVLTEQLNQANLALDTYTKSLDRDGADVNVALKKFQESFFGFDLGEKLKGIEDPIEKTIVVFSALGNAAKSVIGIFNTYQQGSKQGGILGGVGAVLSQSKPITEGIASIAKEFGASLPSFVGPLVQGIGAVFSIVGSLMTAEARKVAADIKKQFDGTIQAFNFGTVDLVDTINAVEAERTRAITQLSGLKGGKDQLAQLLPQLDSQLNSLQQQQKQIINGFYESLNQLDLQVRNGSSSISDLYNTWNAINKQVYDYVRAGGDAVLAEKALSETLQKAQQDAQNQLNTAQDQAVQDAISLNDLYQQRLTLIQNMAKSLFSIQTGDAIERRANSAIDAGIQYQQQKYQQQLQLDNLNSQIDLTEKKLTLEGKIFDIAGNLGDLHRQDEKLQLDAIQLQINKYKELQAIVKAITVDGSGNFSLASGLIPAPTYNINVTLTPSSTAASGSATQASQFGVQVADAVVSELQRQSRQSIS